MNFKTLWWKLERLTVHIKETATNSVSHSTLWRSLEAIRALTADFLGPTGTTQPHGGTEQNSNCECWVWCPQRRASLTALWRKLRHRILKDGVFVWMCLNVCEWRGGAGVGTWVFTLPQRHISVRLTWTRRYYLSRFYCKADRSLSPPDLYFLYFCVLMLRLYASGLTHLTMAVHVPFIKDHWTCTAVCVCVCVCRKDKKKSWLCLTCWAVYTFYTPSRSVELNLISKLCVDNGCV